MAILAATAFGPTFYHIWIFWRSGNANFFYAITLVWGIAQVRFLQSSSQPKMVMASHFSLDYAYLRCNLRVHEA